MHDLHADQKTEISFKMRLRAAWLLGETSDQRSKISLLVRDIYSLRSSAVHGGALHTSKKKMVPDKEIAELLWQGDALCVTIIEKILARGEGWPDWNDTVLGA